MRNTQQGGIIWLHWKVNTNDGVKEFNATKIVLFSNHQLKAALGLYEKYGFAYVEVKDSPFLTADIKMELVLR